MFESRRENMKEKKEAIKKKEKQSNVKRMNQL